jgi:IMP dehydrogenase
MCSKKSEPQFKQLKRAYGFDEVAIVPGDFTINPDQTNVDFQIGDYKFAVPIVASAMDGVVDVNMAIRMGKLGALAVLNLDGIQARYEDADAVLQEIASADNSQVTALLQKVYTEPIKENVVAGRVEAIKKAGVTCAISLVPANTKRLAPIVQEAGCDILVVQSTVTSARHVSKSYRGLIFSEMTKQLKMPIVVGNCVSFAACYELMETGIAGVLIGVGPGAACTSREVLGIGVPQITTTIDCAAARDAYLEETGRYIPIITDGGFKKGGDVCKAFAAGADAVMIGSPSPRLKALPDAATTGVCLIPTPPFPGGLASRSAPPLRWKNSSLVPPRRPTAPRTWSALSASPWASAARPRFVRCTRHR